MNKYQEALDALRNSVVVTDCKQKEVVNQYTAALQELIDKSDRQLLKIQVRDKADGTIHTVGEYCCDCLLVTNGEVEYYNLQNGEGTGGDYEFVEKKLYDGLD